MEYGIEGDGAGSVGPEDDMTFTWDQKRND